MIQHETPFPEAFRGYFTSHFSCVSEGFGRAWKFSALAVPNCLVIDDENRSAARIHPFENRSVAGQVSTLLAPLYKDFS